ncbi:hypothetical protein ACJX0J_015733, partial [Zea mays]
MNDWYRHFLLAIFFIAPWQILPAIITIRVALLYNPPLQTCRTKTGEEIPSRNAKKDVISNILRALRCEFGNGALVVMYNKTEDGLLTLNIWKNTGGLYPMPVAAFKNKQAFGMPLILLGIISIIKIGIAHHLIIT